jgi:AAA ATPase domain
MTPECCSLCWAVMPGCCLWWGTRGVGKTRLTGEGMARAAAAGMVTARGECLPLAGILPLLPVAAALGELAGVDDGGLLAAALNAGPEYVRGEVARLLPGLAPGGTPGLNGPDRGWQRERLFSAVADLLDEAAAVSGSRIGLLVEDVHWADSATLDCVTYLARTGRRDAVTVVATCRSDEAPVAAHVSGWLAQVRAAAGVEELRLGPMCRAEADDLAAALAGGPVPPRVAGDLYARAEGNPFFTEQMVAASLGSSRGDGFRVPAGLPARLADMLMARAARCAGEAQVVLAGLAVAGRPLAEDMLAAITGLEVQAVRRGLRELGAARLLAEDSGGGPLRLRHALLGEAVAGGLLPGERMALHERTARALAAAGDERRAAAVAGPNSARLPDPGNCAMPGWGLAIRRWGPGRSGTASSPTASCIGRSTRKASQSAPAGWSSSPLAGRGGCGWSTTATAPPTSSSTCPPPSAWIPPWTGLRAAGRPSCSPRPTCSAPPGRSR